MEMDSKNAIVGPSFHDSIVSWNGGQASRIWSPDIGFTRRKYERTQVRT